MENKVVIKQIVKDEQVLHVISPDAQADNSLDALRAYLAADTRNLNDLLLKHGAILLRGFAVNSQDDFQTVKDAFFGPRSFSYTDGNSPRTKLSAGIYTSTEYPREYRITLHNELSYANSWPQYLLFYCHIPAAEGGETPLSDSRQLLKKLDKEVVEAFKKGVKYTRFLSGSKGMGKNWMNTFETTDKNVIEDYCKENEIEFFWENDGLYLCQQGPGIIEHPVTKEEVWFNQADQFHPSSLPDEIYRGLELQFSDKKYKYPQYAYYSDGEEIPENYLKQVTEHHFENALVFKWEQGDVVILDNMLVAHGRLPFKGERKIFVSMC